MFMPKASDIEYELPPSGAHYALCYSVVDLGTQETSYMGETKKRHQIRIGWELSDEQMKDGRPFAIFRTYTYSSAPTSRLRQDLESWRGRPFQDSELTGEEGSFDIKNIIGVPCMLSVIHNESNGKHYANVDSIMPVPKGMERRDMKNDRQYMSMESTDAFDRPVFEALPDWLRDKIADSPEYRALNERANDELNPPPHEPDLDDEIPF